MLFIDALNRVVPQPNSIKQRDRIKNRAHKASRDSVDLSLAANEVKEIHIDSHSKTPLTASSSVFANLIEHILSYVFNENLTILSTEELKLEGKDWQLLLQSPPSSAPEKELSNYGDSYQEPEIKKQPPPKQLRFIVPVKPVYGNTVDMTVFLSTHQGSPQTPEFFSTLPKETRLSILRTPYSPEFISQQTSYYHIFLDQDGEPDQLADIYPLLEPPPTEEILNTKAIYGLRLWQTQNSQLKPVVLGDNKVGLVYIGHFRPLNGNSEAVQRDGAKANYLYTKA